MMIVAKTTLVLVSAFYAYGALVHLANMLSLTGFAWPLAPLKWQVLDLVYLVLDVIVAAGLWRASTSGIAAFYVATLSQLALYTVGRAWILDVPDAFRPSAASVAYLDTLTYFHGGAFIAVSLALIGRARGEPAGS